ncbi:MAG: arsenate reductase [Rhodospirillaceae bacterium]|nr:arsenate reductase [Rhodospirillaceae bacterium]
MITIYGLRNCDVCRKAMKWLAAEGIEATMHDFRKDGLDGLLLAQWLDICDWEILLNRRGTTWRKLGDLQKVDMDRFKAESLILVNPSLLKRPVIPLGNKIAVGFKEAEQKAVRQFTFNKA